MSRRMEDVLDHYAEAPDPERPLVCFDETPIQLIGEVRQPVPAQPGRRERYDYEYRRNGTPISSSPSIHIEVGATSGSPTAAPPWTMPTACVNSSTSIIPAPPVSVSCRTICRSTSLGRCMRPSRPQRPDVSCAASNSTSPRSTPVGSTCSSARSPGFSASVSVAASTTPKGSETRSPHGNGGETNPSSHQMDVHNRQSPRQTRPRLSSHRQGVNIAVMNH